MIRLSISSDELLTGTIAGLIVMVVGAIVAPAIKAISRRHRLWSEPRMVAAMKRAGDIQRDSAAALAAGFREQRLLQSRNQYFGIAAFVWFTSLIANGHIGGVYAAIAGLFWCVGLFQSVRAQYVGDMLEGKWPTLTPEQAAAAERLIAGSPVSDS